MTKPLPRIFDHLNLTGLWADIATKEAHEQHLPRLWLTTSP